MWQFLCGLFGITWVPPVKVVRYNLPVMPDPAVFCLGEWADPDEFKAGAYKDALEKWAEVCKAIAQRCECCECTAKR